MDWLLTALSEGWPVLGALALVTVIVIGATRPYIKQDKARRARMEKSDD